MADCNYLKRVNDTLGHEYGDLMLQRVARCIQDSIPQNSVAMRVGGDEFLILCPKCSSDQAAELIARIRRRLAARSDGILTLDVKMWQSVPQRAKTAARPGGCFAVHCTCVRCISFLFSYMARSARWNTWSKVRLSSWAV